MEPNFDPLQDQLDAVERSIEQTFDPGPTFYPAPDIYMNDLGSQLGAVEASIEGTVVPPPPVPEDPHPALIPPEKIVPAYTSDDPAPPSEPIERYWISMEPPLAARPYYTRQGTIPNSYRPHGRGGTGIRNDNHSTSNQNWCAQLNQTVDEGACQNCDKWDDHGNGFHQCYYDWLEEQEDENHTKEETQKEE